MKRIIIGFDKLTPEILDLFFQKYPDGYGDDDIIEFKNASGEQVQAVEIKTNDAIYLVRIGKKLNHFIENYEEEEDHDHDPEFDDNQPEFDEDNFEENEDFD